jgi:transposase
MANWREARRGKYSVAFKKRVVAEALVPGASVANIARAHGLNGNMIFAWRKDPRFLPPEKKRKAVEAELASGGEASHVDLPEGAGFLAVEVTDLPPPSEPIAKASGISNDNLGPTPPMVSPSIAANPLIERPGFFDLGEAPSPPGRIELVLANGHRLLLSGNVDADAVLRLARGLTQGAPV